MFLQGTARRKQRGDYSQNDGRDIRGRNRQTVMSKAACTPNGISGLSHKLTELGSLGVRDPTASGVVILIGCTQGFSANWPTTRPEHIRYQLFPTSVAITNVTSLRISRIVLAVPFPAIRVLASAC